METSEKWLEKVRKFKQDLKAGKVDPDQFPMPNGKKFGECTEADLKEARTLLFEFMRSRGEEAGELGQLIEVLGDNVEEDMKTLIDEIATELRHDPKEE
ncbi:hypothetical protein MYX82_11555 [Acidobacteria bacterium AH-259-D05]|nr:hypothetical protein [Acidobacteria bacterium AH-259-D05]